MDKVKMKRKRVSKNTKIAWRKHSNVKDVLNYLEDKQYEQRSGVPLTLIPDEQLFQVDKNDADLTVNQQKKLRLLKPPKCFSILNTNNDSDKLPKKKKKNIVRVKKEKPKVLQKTEKEPEGAALDIWNKTSPEKKEAIWDWAADNTIKHHHQIKSGHSKSKLPNLPSVEKPHPGMSYNPSYEDHQNLLKLIVDKEKGIIKKEEHLNRVTRDMYSKVTQDKKEENWLKEMSQKSDDEGSDSEVKPDLESINPPVKNAKKTIKQRKKIKEQIKLELERKANKLEKKKNQDIFQLKSIKRKIALQEAKANFLREKRKQNKKMNEAMPKCLSSTKYEEADLEFNTGLDIAGNLRNMKKEGNLLFDRYKSLQRRNVIEPSVRRHRKKAKVKKYVKPGHKDGWKETVAKSFEV